jgi:hypothetical protein
MEELKGKLNKLSRLYTRLHTIKTCMKEIDARCVDDMTVQFVAGDKVSEIRSEIHNINTWLSNYLRDLQNQEGQRGEKPETNTLNKILTFIGPLKGNEIRLVCANINNLRYELGVME